MVHRNPDDGSLAVVGVLLHAQAKSVPFFHYIDQLYKKVKGAIHPASVSETTDGTTETVAPVEPEAKKNEGKENQDEKEHDDEDKDDDDDEDEDEENRDQNGADFESQEIDLNLADESELVVDQDLLTADNNGGGKHPHKDWICSGDPTFGPDEILVGVNLKSFDFSQLIRAIGKFTPRWEYQGSLSTPPCSEHVSWIVTHSPYPIGLSQLKALVALQGFNARAIHEDAGSRQYVPSPE